jgi:drug/metabolite transporter (DMT)-like permease
LSRITPDHKAASTPLTPQAKAARRARWAPVLMFVVPALWSSNYIIARSASGVIDPHLLATGRWLLAGVLLLAFLGPAGVRSLLRHGRQEWRHTLILGALGMGICGAWVYQGARSTTATNIALLYAATPVAIAALSTRLLGEHLRLRQKAGALLALAGVLFVIAKGQPMNLLAVRFTTGDLWIVACALSWTAYSVLLTWWPSKLGTGERLVAIIAGGLVALLPFTLAEAWLSSGPPLGLHAAALVVLAAVLPGVLSYSAYSYLQREMGAARTALMLYLAPVYGAGLAWALLGEVPGWYHAVGAALILPSIALATRK